MIKIISSIIVFIFIHLPSYSTEESYLFINSEHNCTKKYLLRADPIRQLSYYEDTLKYNSTDHAVSLSSCWDIIGSCLPSITFCWKSTKEQEKNLCSLPTELLLYISKFLDSVNIFKLSGVCCQLRKTFNEDFWHMYWAKLSTINPYLAFHSAPLNRKLFFAHLWYSEGRTKLAAHLGHLEAKILRDYSSYGVTIGQDQYFCPSGSIKYISTRQVDNERTEKLKSAEKQKQQADIERHQASKQREESLRFYRGRYVMY